MRFSIRYKFIIGLLLIFCISFNFLSFFMGKIVTENNKKIIKKELLNHEKDTNIFLKQFLLIKGIEPNKEEFQRNIKEIAWSLSDKVDDRIMIYTNSGKLIVDTAYANGNILAFENIQGILDNKEELKLAIKNKSGYNIIRLQDKYIVSFSYPIYADNIKLGIIRYSKDYSYLFNLGYNFLNIIKVCIVVVFILTFTFSILLSTRITIPIVKLSRFTKEVAKGNFDINLNVKSKDEIEDLAKNFNYMKYKIKEQIITIEKDMENFKILEKTRKVFFDNVTHELKTPLTIISGYSQILIQNGFKDEKFSEKAVNKIKKETDRMHDMVLKLLHISKLESKVDVNLKNKLYISDIVNILIDDMSIKANRYDISIKKEISKDIFINGNKDEIRRMVINIIDNSIKYSNVKSSIIVKLFTEGQNCILTIEDSGQGIPDHVISRIFEPFYRVNKNYSREKGSNGLGLSIVKKIVDKHQGEISIESKERVGTKVIIKIPLVVNSLATTV